MSSGVVYKTIANVYDLLEVTYFKDKKTSPRNAVVNLLDEEDVKILDICSGTGANAINIAKKNSRSKIVGIDLSKKMLALAKQKIDKENLQNIRLYKMDATKTKFQEDTFDVVVISLVLHEVNDIIRGQILNEAKRVLKKDGKIIVVEWWESDKASEKIPFAPIKLMEPNGFREFLKLDMDKYFDQFDLYINDVIECPYTRVYEIRKYMY